MTIEGRGQPVEVNVGDCRCPGSPHALGDVVYLKAEVDVPMTLAFNITWQTLSNEGLSLDEFNADMQAAMAGIYLRHSIASWSFVNEKGEGRLIRPAVIAELLPPHKGGLAVAEAANALYYAELTAPLEQALEEARKELAKTQNRELRRQMKTSSPNGQTASSTPATNGSGSSRRKPSSPSSPAITAGKPSTV